MKKIALLLLGLTAVGFSQTQTLFDGDTHNGWYVAPSLRVSMDDADFIYPGIQGGWILNHKYSLGGAFYGLGREPQFATDPDLYYSLGYGGIEFQYEPCPHRLLHLNVQALIGGGMLAFFERDTFGRDWHDYKHRDGNNEDFEYDGFYIFEPAAHVVLNFHENIRIGVGAAYRIVDGIHSYGFDDSDFEGVHFSCFVRVGSF